jgi:carbonic anhydrase/acetyltransferase-like protein (isoleucine patch superfamily)
MNEKKYEFTDETKVVDGKTVKRIRALRDVRRGVQKGDLGGFIADEMSLSHAGKCWVYGNAVVMENAMVTNDAKIGNDAVVRYYARVMENAQVVGDAVVSGWAVISERGYVGGQARVSGNVCVSGNGSVSDNAVMEENAYVCGRAVVNGNAHLSGDAQLRLGNVGDGATVRSRTDVIVLEGYLEEPVLVYRADGDLDGHVLVAGCQRLRLNMEPEDLQLVAQANSWALFAGWRGMRNALLVTVRRWQRDAKAQGASD